VKVKAPLIESKTSQTFKTSLPSHLVVSLCSRFREGLSAVEILPGRSPAWAAMKYRFKLL
jgi:hypothetical protein